MAKDRLPGSLSRFLYGVGETLRFFPDTAFTLQHTAAAAKEKGGVKPFAAYRLRIKTSLSKMCEQSFFLTLLSRFYRSLFTTRVRSFGVLFFVCGFLQILSYFLGGYVPFLAGSEKNLLFGVCFVFLTLLCSFSRGDVRDALKKSLLFRAALSPLFGVKSWQIPSGRSRDHFIDMIFLGVVFAFFSVVFSPVAVLLTLCAVAFALWVFHTPEAGLFTIGGSFFLLPRSVLLSLTVLTLVAFLFKCAVGKRSLVFSSFDGVLLLSLVPAFFSGKKEVYLLLFQLLTLYYLTSCLLRTLSHLRRLLICMTLGGVFCALLLCTRAVVESLLPAVLFRFPPLEKVLFLTPSAGMGTLIVMLFPLTLGLFRSMKGRGKLLLAILTLALLLGAVFQTRSGALWIALILSLLIYFLFTFRSALLWLLSGAFLVVSAWNVLPEEVTQKALALLGFSRTGSPEEASGLFQRCGEAFGFFFWPCVILLFGFFIYQVFRFAAGATTPSAFPQVLGTLCGALAFLTVGIQLVPADERAAVFLFFIVAIPRAALRCAKREEQCLPY